MDITNLPFSIKQIKIKQIIIFDNDNMKRFFSRLKNSIWM
ncbi:MAG: hypothetical protein Gaeavirus1_43 [Gaeavirus sp.]|uniref:Uncharacterized protein n=1 Tax=Gaeavirus sp. TaxID=2487767 RepID=A0A3G4ZYA6_9VIRU|nr:MAG: hypothetical protein Gaeavirus1_43 [Gaeavirus sp.]